ncbi:MAG: Mrp/NBP35 family ATP-binding protein [Anaeromyxobacteraceae bacterium]|nr:Mrp/NBP35 family ATP-binding protein [Anaeromyxobacteraceae bacterium]
MADAPIQLGARGRVPFGHTAAPNDRAPWARHVLLFTSGKGGVGKSTLAVNVASALAQRGLAVGVLDADVHGPSVPRMLQLLGERVRWNDAGQMVPAENFGLKVMSVGLTTPSEDTPLAWRSSVAVSALVQLLDDVAWGPLDVLVVDLPPGTGDVQLTLAQELRIGAAVVVTTPQAVATDDVRRALRLLLEVGVPVAGVVENMSWFEAPDTGTRHRPFGEGGGRALAASYGVPFLGELPLDRAIGEAADAGAPVAAVGSEALRRHFADLAERLWQGLEAPLTSPAGAGPAAASTP